MRKAMHAPAKTPAARRVGTSATAERSAAGPALGRQSEKLLMALSAPGAYATPDSLGEDGRLGIFTSSKGVSLRSGSAGPGDGNDLVSRGLAEWSGAGLSGRKRLSLTQAGRAHLARAGAPDGVDPFFAQHRQTSRQQVEAAGEARNVAIDRDENPLAWLASRKAADGGALIAPEQLEAGERLRRDLTFAQMLPRVTASWDVSLASSEGQGAPLTYSDAVIAARQRVENALRAVGPEFSGVLTDVCGFLKGLELVESERGWPRRSAKLILGLALSALARHYGIEGFARGPSRSKSLRHWGAEDYRPSIDGGRMAD